MAGPRMKLHQTRPLKGPNTLALNNTNDSQR